MATLKQINQALLTASRAEGRPYRRSLPGGLVIEVESPNGDVKLTLSRLNSAPSETEWSTVLRHWPERVPEGVVPERRTEGRRHKLIGRWPMPAEVRETAR